MTSVVDSCLTAEITEISISNASREQIKFVNPSSQYCPSSKSNEDLPSHFECSFDEVEQYTLQELKCDENSAFLSVVDDDTLAKIACYLCDRLEFLLPDLFVKKHSISQRHNQKSTQQIVMDRKRKFSKKIRHFFQIVRGVSSLVLSEMLHAVYLVDMLIVAESIAKKDGMSPIVSEDNLGMLLLCSVILSLKLNRDSSYSNGWWSKSIGIPASIINQSEIVFMQRINHNMFVPVNAFLKYVQQFVTNVKEA